MPRTLLFCDLDLQFQGHWWPLKVQILAIFHILAQLDPPMGGIYNTYMCFQAIVFKVTLFLLKWFKIVPFTELILLHVSASFRPSIVTKDAYTLWYRVAVMYRSCIIARVFAVNIGKLDRFCFKNQIKGHVLSF